MFLWHCLIDIFRNGVDNYRKLPIPKLTENSVIIRVYGVKVRYIVNSATPRRVIGMGAHQPHLPVFGRWARRWINHDVCDAWLVRRQSYGYLPSLRWYQIYTAWWQLTAQDINPIAYAPEFTRPNFAHRPGFEPRPVRWSAQWARI